MATEGGLAPWLEGALAGLAGVLPGIPALVAGSTALPLALTSLVGIEWAPGDPQTALSLHIQVAPGSGKWLDDVAAASELHDPAGLGLDHLQEVISQGLAGSERGFVCEANNAGSYRLTAIYTHIASGGDAWRRLVSVCEVLAVSPATVAALESRPALHRPSHVGVMAQRHGRPSARLVFHAKPKDEDLWAAMASLPQAPKQAIADACAWLDDQGRVENIHVNIDVHEGRCGSRLGVELPFRSSAARAVGASADLAEPHDKALAAELVKRGYFDGRQLDSLLQWQGRRLVDRQALALPVTQMLTALASGQGSIELRTINHIKLVFDQEQETSAKAYLKVARVPARLRPPADNPNDPRGELATS